MENQDNPKEVIRKLITEANMRKKEEADEV